MTPIGSEFMNKTRYEFLPVSAQDQGLPQPPLEAPYPVEAPLIQLPAEADMTLPGMELRTLLENRRTMRSYSEESIPMTELAWLLWATQGVQRVTRRPVTLRPVPSAGARHAFETLLLVNRVDGLEAGLYRYVALEHALVNLNAAADINARITQACLDQQQVAGSAVTFIWVAIVERMQWRYPERGYRYLHLDAGHVCQNLYLAAEGIGCGVCAIAAFNDDLLNAALDLDGEARFAIYVASLGRKCQDSA